MKLAFLLLAACGGSREWAGRADQVRAQDDSAADTDPAVDTDTASDTDTDTDTAADSAPDSDTDTGLPALEGDPCMRAIPTDALVVHDEVTATEDRVSAWVCRGAMYSTGGTNVTAFLESRAGGLLSGTGGRAWVKSGARLVVYAGPNEVWAEDGAEVTVEADGVVVTTCPAIVFSEGPPGGC